MKNILFLISLIFLIACSSEKATKTDLYIYLDFTEGQDYTKALENDVDHYLELMNVTEHSNRNYGMIRVYPLHDVGSATSKTVKLKEGKSELEGNRHIRNKEIDAFKGKLLSKMNETNSNFTNKELKSSHIFTPICKGVKKMSKSDADKKVILIYSDMLENSELANFHSSQIKYESLKSNFDQACGIEDMSDYEVYIVHPVDKHNDKKIRKAENLWGKYLQDKGLDADNFHFDTSIEL